ncbi:cytochrome c oxidase subunit 8C, mitochondrial [Odocoileus virginianus]|uniref:Cytochrome c oxidase subunit 8 n=1 Tax=Odocoileus virginianus TaxID=9874 RepID=A0A6J0W5R8_ODOVR|nr:cytochrome c oxidase subunit 8C, mitochondrial [Odocoileus virginianus texanus]
MRRRASCPVLRLSRSSLGLPRCSSRLLTALRVYSWLRRTGRVMPRLPVLCLFPRRRVTLVVLQPGPLMAHSELPRQRPMSTIEVAVALLVFFTAFLTPRGYVRSNPDQFRRE